MSSQINFPLSTLLRWSHKGSPGMDYIFTCLRNSSYMGTGACHEPRRATTRKRSGAHECVWVCMSVRKCATRTSVRMRVCGWENLRQYPCMFASETEYAYIDVCVWERGDVLECVRVSVSYFHVSSANAKAMLYFAFLLMLFLSTNSLVRSIAHMKLHYARSLILQRWINSRGNTYQLNLWRYHLQNVLKLSFCISHSYFRTVRRFLLSAPRTEHLEYLFILSIEGFHVRNSLKLCSDWLPPLLCHVRL